MSRAYNVIDADGHILEPLDLWDKYMDPKFRDGAPHLVKGEDGKDRLGIEERTVGDSRRGFGGDRRDRRPAGGRRVRYDEVPGGQARRV